jgi:outer membrane receptor for ferrienterochelin and colicins
MNRALLLMFFGFLAAGTVHAQKVLRGTVSERGESTDATPVVGANVYWLGTTSGTTTGSDGTFAISLQPAGARLIVSAVGYVADTIVVSNGEPLRVMLLAEAPQVADVEVVGERSPTVLNYMDPASVHVMTEKELFKAACCNLSESFETNPSIDVAFTDAITGTRQIEMLGLAGTYSQITLENLPAIRGLTSNVGLTYIPGPWIDNIQVSKGVGSVANGYESITGQINVELRKPVTETDSRFFLNMFGNSDLRLESNLHYRERLGDDWSTMTLLHLGTQRRPMDGNGDRFLDLPLSTTINALQRFMFTASDAVEGQFGIQYVDDEKEGGTMLGTGMSQSALAANPSEYGFRTKSRQWRFAGKTGHVFSAEDRRSVGLQYSYADYRQDAFFGPRNYAGRERTGYVNLLYESNLGPDNHHLRLGLAFLYDGFDEQFAGASYRRTERVPGAFAEYTFTQDEVFSMVAGIRADHHNLFGSFLTPRLHLRYALSEDWVLRAVGGRGARSANVFAENIAYLASARAFDLPSSSSEYPFDQEVAWNVGFNVTRYFTWDGREGTIVADFYRTMFDRQVVVDLDRNPQEVVFQNLAGRSFSNSIQLELNAQPVRGLDTRLAYRFLDVRQTTAGTLQHRPFVARHRAFLNLGYTTDQEGPDDPRMMYDVTLQWFGAKRLPETDLNPAEFRVRGMSPEFALINLQATRSFTLGFDLYLGVENLLDFRQADPIVDAANPTSRYFDSSYIWGPVAGRMVYIGLRLRM